MVLPSASTEAADMSGGGSAMLNFFFFFSLPLTAGVFGAFSTFGPIFAQLPGHPELYLLVWRGLGFLA